MRSLTVIAPATAAGLLASQFYAYGAKPDPGSDLVEVANVPAVQDVNGALAKEQATVAVVARFATTVRCDRRGVR